ncbi:MAG: hypothetical protein INH41_01075 [Myxococcaceae bacterium]|nr:hypothetical protein [Myxococcaceae bacterium]MCA3010971.1 hypothetical protein [Myxococcaceae bacterium]
MAFSTTCAASSGVPARFANGTVSNDAFVATELDEVLNAAAEGVVASATSKDDATRKLVLLVQRISAR